MRDLFNNFSRLLDVTRGLDADMRTAQALEYDRLARQRAWLIEHHHLTNPASGDLGDAMLGAMKDAEQANLFDPRGLFLGAFGGRLAYLNSDGHHLVYARAGGGKGTTSVQPILAGNRGSIFVVDVKDGELHFSTAAHRERNLGQRVVTLDPWGITENGSIRCNPLHGLGSIAERGGHIDDEADEIALILIPRGKADAGDNAWVVKGARRLLSLRMKHLAYSERDRLTLSGLWRFVNCGDAELEAAFDAMIASLHEDVAGTAAALKSVFEAAPKQFEAYRSAGTEALAAFAPGGALAGATSGSDIDFGR